MNNVSKESIVIINLVEVLTVRVGVGEVVYNRL